MTWLLRGLALVLAIGAIIAALIGYRLSSQPAPPPAPPAPTETVIQAAKPLKAGQPIGAEDIALATVTAKPAGSFAAAAQVVGQTPLLDVAAGETLTRAHFPTPGQLARGLREGERAVAIKVDEVVGLGGFAQPGDLVDVLFYLRGSGETRNTSSAQVVLAGVRLLAFGDAVRQPGGGEGEAAAPTSRAAEKVAGRAKAITSAVIAVPEAMAPRLMLAANSGNLRLSLRPIEAAAPAPAPASPAPATAKAPAAPAAEPHLIHLAELAQAKPAEKKEAAKSRGAAPGVVMHEGETVRSLGAPR